MRHFILLAAPLALSACVSDDSARTAKFEEAKAQVAAELKGYAPVGTRTCLPARTNAPTQIYADGTVLVRQGGKTYGQNLGEGCARASSAHTVLVTEGTFGNMCSGTIARVVDSATGMYAGSCTISDWTVYEKTDEADAS